MPEETHPRKVQGVVEQGFDRLRNFRQARLMFMRNYVGPYYDRTHGDIGTDPLNLIFNAIRILLPNIVTNFPTTKVSSRFAAHTFYADLWSKAIDQNTRDLQLRFTYRQLIVDALFTLGILKSGLKASRELLHFDDNEGPPIDNGEVYTRCIDFDNFVVSPLVTDLRNSPFFGDKFRVSRQMILDAPSEQGWNKDLIKQLPSAYGNVPDKHGGEKVESLSNQGLNRNEFQSITDDIELVELYVPAARANVTIPAPGGPTFDKYLRVLDHYGPDEGPYTFLAVTPPVPNNPIPISLVGIWNDLHVMGNRTVKKILDQADRQKDLVFYKRSAADDAMEARDAPDGHAVATDDPDGIRPMSFGGQNPANVQHIAQVQSWFNMMAANPQGVGGLDLRADSATEASILQANASVGLKDLQDLTYIAVQEETKKRAWYMHHDPLIEIPIPYRRRVPAMFEQGPLGPVMLEPAREEMLQMVLTPEVRRGDWIDFTFEIEPESMGRMDASERRRRAMEFASSVMPNAATAAQIAQQMGVSFSLPKFLMNMAKEMDIRWMEEVFTDPEFTQQIQAMQALGPKPAQATAQGVATQPQILQNGQMATTSAKFPSIFTQRHREAQEGAAQAQSELRQ